jgi:hypothetical protein
VLVSRNLLRLLAERINGTERITHPTREAPGSHYGRPETMHGPLHHA